MEKRTLGILAVVLIIMGVAGLVLSPGYSHFNYNGYPGYYPWGMMEGDESWYGMMGGRMMGGTTGGMMLMMGGNMLVSGGTPYNQNGSLVTMEQARDIANRYLVSLNNPDIELADLEEWEFNFYVEYKEKSTGTGAFQMLIDKYTGTMFPEMGPNMMWNTKYMMGLQAGAMSITEEQAGMYARQFLDSRLPGTKAENGGVFYGYYHFDVKKDDMMYGMLDINGYSGQAWYHTWHGNFIQED